MCCSGHGKNGSLCILRQSVRPEIITEVLDFSFLNSFSPIALAASLLLHIYDIIPVTPLRG